MNEQSIRIDGRADVVILTVQSPALPSIALTLNYRNAKLIGEALASADRNTKRVFAAAQQPQEMKS